MCDTIGDPKGHSEADRDFHTVIFLATHNFKLSQMIDLIVVGIYANAVMASAAVMEGQRQSLPYHAAVLAAIEAQDPIGATAAANRLLDSWHPAPERVRLAKRRERTLARS
jgi:DNA-binding FadR family transcriptional regulator